MRKYLLTIDTQRSNIYEPVRTFLAGQKSNISSYFSGGWADFVCEAHMPEATFKTFKAELVEVLNKAGAAELCGNDVNNLISIFEVRDPLVICGKPVADLTNPPKAVLQTELGDRLKFEMTLRDYRSAETLKLFNGDVKAVQKYLRRLKEKGIIICFRVVADISRFTNCDYVPLIGADNRTLPSILERDPNLLKPVKELFAVSPAQTTDPTEKEVSHIFVNQYQFPSERTEWKHLLYEKSTAAINVYSYPLEGPVNETSLYLSDVPEVLHRATRYRDKGLQIGRIAHASIKVEESPLVNLPLLGLAKHGVTFGEPGSGKTNFDLGLVKSAVNALDSVVVFDNSRSVVGKLEGTSLPEFSKPTSLVITSCDSPDDVDKVLQSIFSTKGLIVVEIEKRVYAKVFLRWGELLAQMPDFTKSNRPREIKALALVEEAYDLFSDPSVATHQQLMSTLDQAFRKGWGIWLSLQRPTQLGQNHAEARMLLKNLVNKVVYGLRDKSEVQLIRDALADGHLDVAQLSYFERTLDTLKQYTAICVGASIASGERLLPPIPVELDLIK